MNTLNYIAQLHSAAVQTTFDLITERADAAPDRSQEIELELDAISAYQTSLAKTKCAIYTKAGALEVLQQYQNGLISLDELVEKMALISVGVQVIVNEGV